MSAGSDTALLASQTWNPSSTDSNQAPQEAAFAQDAVKRAVYPLPPVATKGHSASAAGPRQLHQSSELRRVPRPRFRLANQRPTATRRSLLNDFDAVEDCCDDSSSHACIDYGFNASNLIKAHVEAGYHQQQLQQQQQLRDWYLRKQSNTEQKVMPATHRCKQISKARVLPCIVCVGCRDLHVSNFVLCKGCTQPESAYTIRVDDACG